uniref:CCHC-type domain-containing protein n=1 Tax=Oryza brachyantha TaxID=4533 RepID=J3L0J0_ORYBR
MAPPVVDCWTDGLPLDVLLIMLAHIHCLADRVSFSAVCRSWRSTHGVAEQQAEEEARAIGQHAAPQRAIPWLLAPSSPDGNPTITSFVSGLTSRISLPASLRGARFFGSFPGGWLAVALGMCGEYLLANIHSGETVPLPSRMCNKVSASETTTTVAVIQGVALSAAPNSPGCLAGALVSGTSNITFCQPGISSVWTGIEVLPGAMEDMIYYEGRFHVISRYELMAVFSVPPPSSSSSSDHPDGLLEVTDHPLFMPIRVDYVLPYLDKPAAVSRYLVVSRNKLLMVVRYFLPATTSTAGGSDGAVAHRRRTAPSKVFQMEKFCSHGAFWEAKALDGRVLFLGRCCSRAFEASDIHGFDGGGIYFLDDVGFDLSLVMQGAADYPCVDVGMYAAMAPDPDDVAVARPPASWLGNCAANDGGASRSRSTLGESSRELSGVWSIRSSAPFSRFSPQKGNKYIQHISRNFVPPTTDTQQSRGVSSRDERPQQDLRILLTGRKKAGHGCPAAQAFTPLLPERAGDEGGWKQVRNKQWKRKQPAFTTANNLDDAHSRRRRFRKHMAGRCFRCLRTNHQVKNCRDPLRCWFCLSIGHLASNCPKRRNYKPASLLPNPTTQPFAISSSQDFPPLPVRSKLSANHRATAPRWGMEALSSRPDADSMVISSTGEVEHLRQRFSSQSVVAWSVGETADRVDINTFPDDVRIAFRIHRLDIQVTKYHPEDYFVTLSKQADRESILRQSRLETPSGRVYQFSPWTERRHGQRVKLRYRVRLCLEGIPMHGRTEAVAAKAVGRQCSVHYVEEYSRRRTYNRTYDLWVRTADLSYIHKASWLTLTDADEELPSTEIPLVELEPHRNPLPEGEKRGELYFVLIHVDTVEDLRTMESRMLLIAFPLSLGQAGQNQTRRGGQMMTRTETVALEGVTEADHCKDASRAARQVAAESRSKESAKSKTKTTGAGTAQDIGRPTAVAAAALHFNKPLPPDSLKTIMALVEKGGCKAMRLKSAKKKATVETKLQQVTQLIVTQTLGERFSKSYALLPADGTRGGILLATDENFFSILDVTLHTHSLSATINMRETNTAWSIIVVYGPQLDAEKIAFLQELKDLKPLMHSAWLLIGDFNLIYKATKLFPLSSSSSDHSALLLVGKDDQPRSTAFRFESYWLKFPDIKDVIKESWEREILADNPFSILRLKLCRLAGVLKRWKNHQIGDIRLQFAVANEVIFQLDKAQEFRALSKEERKLHTDLKSKALGLAVLNKIRIRQRSRQTALKDGDVNSKYFHLKANGRRRKNYIQTLQSPTGLAVSVQEKNAELHRFFSERLATNQQRLCTINWDAINFPTFDLANLEADITEDELQKNNSIPTIRKGTRAGWVYGRFLQIRWFMNFKTQNLKELNSANICLLPKKGDATAPDHYRLINLIHSVGKIITKTLANRLASKLDQMVSNNQSAFIKKRAIHDNFIFVQGMIKKLHCKKERTILLKIDISKAFDSVNWSFLLEVMQRLGFRAKWRSWITNLLTTSTSRVLLKGIPGDEIQHLRGLRQDDVAIFIKPLQQEIQLMAKVLELFARISGLRTNLTKTELYPIAYGGQNLEALKNHLPGIVKNLPCTYLGMPLHFKKLRKVDYVPLLDKIGGRVPGWKRKFFTSPGRTTLVKSVLTSLPIYHLTAIQTPKWIIKKVDKHRRAFLWKGEDPDKVHNGSSLVNWHTVCRRLGILDLEKFARALRIRWLWMRWTDDSKPWVQFEIPCDEMDKILFKAATEIILGDGRKAQFWSDNWLQNRSLQTLAPNLYRLAKRKQTSVHSTMENNSWLSSLRQLTSMQEIDELVTLGGIPQIANLIHITPDTIRWKLTTNDTYSSKSAYEMQFIGSNTTVCYDKLWKAECEPKHRQLGWLILHKRTLTANNLLRRHWPFNWICSLCGEVFEDTTHLFKECSYTRETWNQLCLWGKHNTLLLLNNKTLKEWWRSFCEIKPKSLQKNLIRSLITTWWHIWIERNSRVFNSQHNTAIKVAHKIKLEIDLRLLAFRPP